MAEEMIRDEFLQAGVFGAVLPCCDACVFFFGRGFGYEWVVGGVRLGAAFDELVDDGILQIWNEPLLGEEPELECGGYGERRGVVVFHAASSV